MLRFKIRDFSFYFSFLDVRRTEIQNYFRNGAEDKYIPAESSKKLNEQLEVFREICQDAGLTMSLLQIKRLQTYLLSEQCLNSKFVEEVDLLKKYLNDELSFPIFFAVKPENVAYYATVDLFGKNVSANFPSAIFDIEESGKCFALARYTACVMHLQRALEIAFKSYAILLDVTFPKPQPSWQDIINKTTKEIKDRNDKAVTTTTWTSKEEKDFCENVQPFLVSVKDAWRNPSMHADAKYTEEEAKEIFEAVKTFMRNLAEHLNEKGKFTKRKKK